MFHDPRRTDPVVVAATSETPSFLKGLPIPFGQLGYLFVGIAGGLVLLDRYFGYSTVWMRYILATQAIEKAREVFRLEWTALLLVLSTTTAGANRLEVVDRLIQRVRSVIVGVRNAASARRRTASRT